MRGRAANGDREPLTRLGYAGSALSLRERELRRRHSTKAKTATSVAASPYQVNA